MLNDVVLRYEVVGADKIVRTNSIPMGDIGVSHRMSHQRITVHPSNGVIKGIKFTWRGGAAGGMSNEDFYVVQNLPPINTAD